jgi:hypothetical protein
MKCTEGCRQLVKGEKDGVKYFQCTNGSKVVGYHTVNGFRNPIRGAIPLEKDKKGNPIKICKDFE